MVGYNIKIIKSESMINKVLVRYDEANEKSRDVIVEVGKEMVVKPLNKRKMKHRDRRVIINKIIDEGMKGFNAQVKFLDTNRTGKVEVIDLDNLV